MLGQFGLAIGTSIIDAVFCYLVLPLKEGLVFLRPSNELQLLKLDLETALEDFAMGARLQA